MYNTNKIVNNILGKKIKRDCYSRNKIITCTYCDGDGLDEKMRTCKKCDGSGEIVLD